MRAARAKKRARREAASPGGPTAGVCEAADAGEEATAAAEVESPLAEDPAGVGWFWIGNRARLLRSLHHKLRDALAPAMSCGPVADVITLVSQYIVSSLGLCRRCDERYAGVGRLCSECGGRTESALRTLVVAAYAARTKRLMLEWTWPDFRREHSLLARASLAADFLMARNRFLTASQWERMHARVVDGLPVASEALQRWTMRVYFSLAGPEDAAFDAAVALTAAAERENGRKPYAPEQNCFPERAGPAEAEACAALLPALFSCAESDSPIIIEPSGSVVRKQVDAESRGFLRLQADALTAAELHDFLERGPAPVWRERRLAAAPLMQSVGPFLRFIAALHDPKDPPKPRAAPAAPPAAPVPPATAAASRAAAPRKRRSRPPAHAPCMAGRLRWPAR